MPWNEVSLMSLRLEFVALATAEGASVRQLCRRYGISPEAAHEWLARHRAGGPAALADRSRRPAGSPGRCPEPTEAAVLRLRDAHPAWGGRKLGARLIAAGHDAPAASTITAILRRRGRLDPARSAAHRPLARFGHDAPNRPWQIGFKGRFATAAGRCRPLTALEDHSRFALGLPPAATSGTRRSGAT